IGQPPEKIGTAESIAASRARAREAIVEGVLPPVVEIELIHKDGHVLPVESRASFIRDVQGRVVEVQSMYRDITERKRADDALHKSLAENEQRRRVAEAIAEIGRQVAEGVELEPLQRRIIDVVATLLQAAVVRLYMADPATGDLVELMARTTSQASGAVGLVTVPPGVGVIGLAVRERRSVWTTDGLADARVHLPADVRAYLE